jgi:hypothetical protein
MTLRRKISSTPAITVRAKFLVLQTTSKQQSVPHN